MNVLDVSGVNEYILLSSLTKSVYGDKVIKLNGAPLG